MNFSIYGDDSNGLLRIDPRTKLLIFFTGSMISFNCGAGLILSIYCCIVCILLALCGKPWTALKGIFTFALAVYARYCIDIYDGGAPFIVTLLQEIIAILLYGFPIIMSFTLLVQTTRISQFLSALQTMKLPIKAIIPIAVFFRFVPTVIDEWSGIRKAMAFRGIPLSPSAIICHPLKTVEYILIPLLFGCVNVMEELASSATARGMDSEIKRSSYETVRLNFYDIIIMIIIVSLTVWSFLWRGVLL